jgi:hypothetical protein
VEHIKTVAVLMRHDSYRTTEKYYLGLVDKLRRRAAGQAAQAGEPTYQAFPDRRQDAETRTVAV